MLLIQQHYKVNTPKYIKFLQHCSMEKTVWFLFSNQQLFMNLCNFFITNLLLMLCIVVFKSQKLSLFQRKLSLFQRKLAAGITQKKKKEVEVTKKVRKSQKKENHIKICKAYLKKYLLEKQDSVITAYYYKDCNYKIIVSKIQKQLYFSTHNSTK